MPAIRDNLKTLRNISGLSQKEAAEALHVTRQTISSYETGRTEPDWETLKRLADLYHADIHDVLYGGNRMQRRIHLLRRAALCIGAVLLLSLLARSVLLWGINTFLVIQDGTAMTSDNRYLVEKRFALRDAADNIARAGIAVFYAGCLVLLVPLMAIRKTCSFKKPAVWLSGFVLAVFAVPAPFMLNDAIYKPADYYFPVWSVLPCLALIFLIFVILYIVQRVKMKAKV